MPPRNPNQPPLKTQVRPLPKAPPEPLTGSPYDFIMDSSAKPKRSVSFNFGSGKLVGIAVGGVLLVITLVVIFSLFSGNSSNPAIVAVAQQQAEISRVASLQIDNVEEGSIHDFALNTALSMQSDQANLLSYASAHGATISDKMIALGTNSQTDAALENASASGTLDTTLRSTLQTDLQQYQQTVQQAYTSVSNPEAKKLLESFYTNAGLLLEQSKQ